MLALELSGNFRASLNRDQKSLTFSDGQGNVLRYGGLHTYDRNGTDLTSWLELRGSKLFIGVADDHAAYPITIDPTLEATLTASGTGSFIGANVSSSGNTIAAVGSAGVYVYVKPAGGWTNMTETAVLTTSDRGRSTMRQFLAIP